MLIQRVARGLLELLSIQDGRAPSQFSETVVGQLDLLQFYGLQQRQIAFNNNAAAAEGVTVGIGPGAPLDRWCILYALSGSFGKTATQTALRGTLFINRGGLSIAVASQELGPFGATETGTVSVAFVPPYPWLLPPGSQLLASAQVIGTDATASVGIQAELGILG